MPTVMPTKVNITAIQPAHLLDTTDKQVHPRKPQITPNLGKLLSMLLHKCNRTESEEDIETKAIELIGSNKYVLGYMDINFVCIRLHGQQ